MTSARQCSAHMADFAQFCPFTGLPLVGVAWCSPGTDTSPGRAGGKSGEFTKKVRAPGSGGRSGGLAGVEMVTGWSGLGKGEVLYPCISAVEIKVLRFGPELLSHSSGT